MGVPPLGLVGFPRALGLVLMMPVLVIFADFWGLAGGALAAVGGLHVPPASFLVEIPSHFHLYDVAAGLLKGEIFALLTAVVAVNAGISARRSSRGVGAAAVRSFVTAAVYILVSNFFVAAMVF
jgi:phospholipid/cholesterol/gamma-HCH transport system permease protein